MNIVRNTYLVFTLLELQPYLNEIQRSMTVMYLFVTRKWQLDCYPTRDLPFRYCKIFGLVQISVVFSEVWLSLRIPFQINLTLRNIRISHRKGTHLRSKRLFRSLRISVYIVFKYANCEGGIYSSNQVRGLHAMKYS